jgi:glycosyltransferase involved in cell wall biosynthesis
MNLQILISTVDDNFFSRNLDIIPSFLIINQLIKKNKSLFSMNNLISYSERGLSKSRNKALKNSSSDICLISDDDLIYKRDIENIILQSFEDYKDADIITFEVETPNGRPYKKYKNKVFWHTKKTLMRVSSVEIAVRRKSIVNSKLKFDEDFGLGSIFPTGEEVIFLMDAMRKKLKILSIPIAIVLHPIESSGKNYSNTNLIVAKGAVFYRVFGFFSYLICILFAVKKYKSSNKGFLKFLSLMYVGICRYRGVKNVN